MALRLCWWLYSQEAQALLAWNAMSDCKNFNVRAASIWGSHPDSMWEKSQVDQEKMELLERFYVYANNFVTCLCAIQWSCFYGPLCLSFKEGVEKWIKVHFIEFRRVGQAWATCRLRTLFSSFVRFGDKAHQTLDSACKKPIFHNCAAQTSNHQVTQKSHMAEALVCWQFACMWPAVIEIDL